jgi:proteasome assembly chaperone (PAC2) family protein
MTGTSTIVGVVEIVRWEDRPKLRRPVLIAAFEGWNDAGDAASTAARYLAANWTARRFATLEPEEFYDFTAARPQVRLVDGLTRQIDWPSNEFTAAAVPGGSRDVVFLHGVEPQLKWRTFCASILGVASAVGVEMVVTLGALLTDTPHTRPVRVSGTAGDAALATKLGLQRSSYEGPTGIVGVLTDAMTRASIPTASFWAAVPHYISQVPSPKATLALVERTMSMLDVSVDVTDLQIASAAYERSVDERLEVDDDAAAYVRQLEEAAEEEEAEEAAGGEPTIVDEHDLPSSDALAAEVERFLRDHGDE